MSVSAARQPALGPVLLALDTATERIHAALSIGSGASARTTTLDLPGGAQASSTLLPALGGLLADAGLAWPDVDALAFGAGPGAFTGLRTACATVQGLALGLDVPVLALDTLMAVVEDARLAGQLDIAQPVWALQDARMGELYAAAFQWDGTAQAWQATAPPQLWPLAHALSVVTPGVQWAGNAVQAEAALLAPLAASRRGGLAATAPDPVAAPRGAALASLARAAWARGEAIDAALALPRYVRDKVAQTTAERQQPSQQAAPAQAAGLTRA
jgi:tRNA threonylcarbamoyladenosine biosynthesis protein TsaB